MNENPSTYEALPEPRERTLAVRSPDGTEPPEPTLLALLHALAVDSRVSVEKLAGLMQLQRDAQRDNAERAFNVAMIAAQEEMRPIVKTAENSNNHSRYATLESIDAIVRPIYTRHGFALTFAESPDAARTPGNLRLRCTVRHSAGHSEFYELEGALDTTGAQGKSTKTAIQGMGSTNSYLRRYLEANVWNLVFRGQDNDGVSFVTEEELDNLRSIISEIGLTPIGLHSLLAIAGVERLEELPRGQYKAVLQALLDKRRAQARP